MEVFKKISMILTKPKLFFKQVKKEQYLDPYIFVVACYAAVMFVISLIMGFFPDPEFQSLGVMGAAMGAAVSFMVTMIGILVQPWVAAGISHLGVFYFKGHGAFVDTFRVLTYGFIVSLLYMIPIQLFDIVVRSGATPASPLAWGNTIIIVIIAVIGVIHALWVEVEGFKLYHKLSTGKSIVCVFVIPMIFAILVFLALMAIMMLIFGGLMAAGI
ncbi:MAG: YIP1 family protein [Candidatus Nanoarchaeia archaeon]